MHGNDFHNPALFKIHKLCITIKGPSMKATPTDAVVAKKFLVHVRYIIYRILEVFNLFDC